MKNYGLNIEKELAEESKEDYVFGSVTGVVSEGIGGIPVQHRQRLLPKGEVQVGAEDNQSCASNAPDNMFEAEFNWLFEQRLITYDNLTWLIDNGYHTKERGFEFSDAYVAINSGTTRRGNSLKAPLHAVHKKGLIPKHLMPLGKNMTFAEFHDLKRITPEIEVLGLEFAERFPITYEKVYQKNFVEVLKKHMLVVAGHAWERPVNGYYLRTNKAFNHAFVIFIASFLAFDSYIDSVDGDFIKDLANDYKFFKHGYRVIINQRDVAKDKCSTWRSFMNYFFKEPIRI